jgi:hypothetical protein
VGTALNVTIDVTFGVSFAVSFCVSFHMSGLSRVARCSGLSSRLRSAGCRRLRL